MAYSNEDKAKARDYYEVNGSTLEQISEKLNIPISTLSSWKSKEKWIEKKAKDSDVAKIIQSGFNDVKKEIEDSVIKKLESRNLPVNSQIVENRVNLEILNATGVNEFNAMIAEGATIAYQQLKRGYTEPKDVKTLTDTIINAKYAIHGKDPETVIINSNEVSEYNLATMTAQQLKELRDKQKNKMIGG